MDALLDGICEPLSPLEEQAEASFYCFIIGHPDALKEDLLQIAKQWQMSTKEIIRVAILADNFGISMDLLFDDRNNISEHFNYAVCLGRMKLLAFIKKKLGKQDFAQMIKDCEAIEIAYINEQLPTLQFLLESCPFTSEEIDSIYKLVTFQEGYVFMEAARQGNITFLGQLFELAKNLKGFEEILDFEKFIEGLMILTYREGLFYAQQNVVNYLRTFQLVQNYVHQFEVSLKILHLHRQEMPYKQEGKKFKDVIFSDRFSLQVRLNQLPLFISLKHNDLLEYYFEIPSIQKRADLPYLINIARRTANTEAVNFLEGIHNSKQKNPPKNNFLEFWVPLDTVKGEPRSKSLNRVINEMDVRSHEVEIWSMFKERP